MEQQDDPNHAVDDDDDESLLNLEEGTLVEIRPGRNLFCRHKKVVVGEHGNDNDGDHHGRHHDQQQQKDKEEEHVDLIHLICIHGTAASHDQFLPLLEQLKKNNNNNNENNRRRSNINVHAWMYDAVGCGRSPDPATTDSSSSSSSSSPYSDEEQVLDLDAFLRRFVIRRKIGKEEEQQQEEEEEQKLVSNTKKCRIFFIAHSYGPNWVYKWMEYNNNQRQQQLEERKVFSSDHVVVEGLALISTGLLDDDDDDRIRKKLLVKGGPAIFKYCPLWILNCLQPTMTELFLKMGYSKNTHTTKPQMISEARHVNNRNNMKTVCQYYNSHDWTSQDELQDFCNDFIVCRTPTIPATNGTTGRRRRRNVKVLVVHGVEDQIIPIEKGQVVANILSPPTTTPNENEQNSSNNGLIVVEDASHSIMQEQPDVLSKHILQLIVL